MRRTLQRILRRTTDARRAGIDDRRMALDELVRAKPRRTGIDHGRVALDDQPCRAGVDQRRIALDDDLCMRDGRGGLRVTDEAMRGRSRMRTTGDGPRGKCFLLPASARLAGGALTSDALATGYGRTVEAAGG